LLRERDRPTCDDGEEAGNCSCDEEEEEAAVPLLSASSSARE
jgi:hypothetical protein